MRLRDLEEARVIRQRRLGPPTSTRAYELTESGHELEPILIALGRWGGTLPLDPESTAELSPDALMLALRTTFDADHAGDLDVGCELHIDGDRFRTSIVEGVFDVRRDGSDDADVRIACSAAVLRALVFARRPLAEAARAGDVTVTGSRALANAYLQSFPRPVPRDM